MPKTPSETSPEALPQLFTQMHAQTLDAMAALSQAGQRVMQELVELSTTAAKEGVRTCAELQSAALDAARELPAAQAPDADAAATTRDYFAVEDTEGGRFWLFREGLYLADAALPRWYLHGLFG